MLSWFNNFFHFNRRQRRGILQLSLLLTFIIVIKIYMAFSVPDFNPQISHITLQPDRIPAKESGKNREKMPEEAPEEKVFTYIEFDPNTINAKEARELGFSNKLTQTLLHFREKGGKFYKKEDLKKLYGLSTEAYQRLEPYIQIDPTENTTHKPLPKNEVKDADKLPLELNKADSMQLIALRGIGPAYAKRIIRFREALGGFYEVQQLKEVYGISDSLFAQITSQIHTDASQIRKLFINRATASDLRKHPYLKQANTFALVRYREKHGLFKQVEDLMNTGLFEPEQLKKLKPYLSFE